MKLIESLKKRKFLLFNIFFTLYIGINLVGGERGLISYFDKKSTYDELIEKDIHLDSSYNNKLQNEFVYRLAFENKKEQVNTEN